MIETLDLEENVCPHCGQRIAYRSAVSKGHVRVLRVIVKLIQQKGVNVVHVEKELVQAGLLTGNQGRNCTHMVRLGLLAHLQGETGNYVLTDKAMRFLNGEPIPKYVIVSKRTEGKGSHTVTHSKELVSISAFSKKGEEWEVPGFEIKAGRVITGNSNIFEV